MDHQVSGDVRTGILIGLGQASERIPGESTKRRGCLDGMNLREVIEESMLNLNESVAMAMAGRTILIGAKRQLMEEKLIAIGVAEHILSTASRP